MLQILKLRDEGRTQQAIADTVGCCQQHVSELLREWEDTRELAKKKLHSKALALAEKVTDAADVDQALEVLDRINVAPKRSDGKGLGVTLVMQQGVSIPGIALSPSTFASDALETGALND